MDYVIRQARLGDRPVIKELIAESARGLSRDDYTGPQIEAAINSVFGVDTDLILDGTCFVAESGGALRWSAAAGGANGGRSSAATSSRGGTRPRSTPRRSRRGFGPSSSTRRTRGGG
jgi:hypothetical protein